MSFSLVGLRPSGNHPVASRHPSLKKEGRKKTFPLLPEEGCLHTAGGVEGVAPGRLPPQRAGWWESSKEACPRSGRGGGSLPAGRARYMRHEEKKWFVF
jgi:hypothetical protein